MAATRSGRYARGGVRHPVDGALRRVANCHGEPCRRVTGHLTAATAADVDDTRRWHEPAPAVRYGSCGRCGSTLPWRASDRIAGVRE